jgi:hypothetical protein
MQSMAAAEPVHALVSVHDVMPETLAPVQRILDLLQGHGVSPVTLLVVPGRAWNDAGLARLRDWQDQGHRLAGHGWSHTVARFGGLAHRLHGSLISRRVAEHLALDAAGISQLIGRCHAWFGERGLEAPTLYVPPAWALGPIGRTALTDLPFTHYEVLTGVISGATGRFAPLPMLGYEADSPLRAWAIRRWNHHNRRRARAAGWLRIGIHPQDLSLALAADLRADLTRYSHWTGYEALAA